MNEEQKQKELKRLEEQQRQLADDIAKLREPEHEPEPGDVYETDFGPTLIVEGDDRMRWMWIDNKREGYPINHTFSPNGLYLGAVEDILDQFNGAFLGKFEDVFVKKQDVRDALAEIRAALSLKDSSGDSVWSAIFEDSCWPDDDGGLIDKIESALTKTGIANYQGTIT